MTAMATKTADNKTMNKDVKKVKVSIPSKASIVVCDITGYACLAFGFGMLFLALYGLWADVNGSVLSALAANKSYAGAMQIVVNVYPILFFVAAYFFFIFWGMSKIVKQRKLEITLADLLRRSKRY